MLKGAQSSLLFWVVLVTIAAMIIPMLTAGVIEDWRVARTFMYYALFSLILLFLYALAVGSNQVGKTGGAALLEATSVYVIVPIVAAAPVVELYPGLGWRIVIFDMISAFTTTGASRLADIGPVSEVVQLWRAMLAWLGGYYFLLIAYSVLGPLRINGCDTVEDGYYVMTETYHSATYDASWRTIIRRFNKRALPAYFIFTLILFIALTITGLRPVEAVITAMSTLSTSGIILAGTELTLMAELVIFAFLCFALSRFFMTSDGMRRWRYSVSNNPEVQVGFGIVLLIGVFLTAQAVTRSSGGEAALPLSEILLGFWGAVFSAMSFLTTHGIVSQFLERLIQGDGNTVILIFMALAVCGGGVATTAGGVKLLRIFTLTQHGMRELNRLSLPHSVNAAQGVRAIRRRVVINSWVVVMLFGFSIMVFTLIFTLLGNQFETSLLLAVAGLSTTGPLLSSSINGVDIIQELSTLELTILEVAMIVGRLETLAVLALFNPILWQNRIRQEKRRMV
ncbi:MAG: potassium transporter TrkG [Pseudomonadota bacterium]